MQKVLRFVILAGIFAVPFIPLIVANDLFFPFITGKNFTFRIIVEIIFALWLILILYDQSARPKKSALWYILLLFIGSIGISTVLAENPHKSFWSNFERMDGYITLLHLGAYFTVLVSMLKDEKYWKWLWNTSIAVSIFLGLYGLMQLAGFFPINQGGVRVDATFGNATYLAVYMLFHFFMVLYALIRWNPSKWVQIAYICALVLQVIMIFYAATRGTTLGLLGGFLLSGLIFAFFAGKGNEAGKTLRRVGIAVVLGVMLLVTSFIAFKDTEVVQNHNILGRFASINFEAAETRLTVWSMALPGALERPFFGWGQENFNFIFNERYQASMYAQEPWFDRAHNQFLDWLVAGGVFGFILYLLLYAIALWYLWRRNTFGVGARAILTGLLAGYAFHNLFVFDNLLSSVLFIGLLAYITTRRTASQYEIQIPALSSGVRAGIAGAIVVLLIVVLYVANVPGMTRASTMIDAMRSQPGGLEENFEFFKRALEGDSLGRQEAHEQLVQFAIQVRRPDLLAFSTEELRNEIAVYTRERLVEEIARQPNDARLRVFYGSFLRQLGDLEAAEQELLIALELSPQKQSTMFELGLIATLQNDAQNAVRWFKTAFDVEPEYDRARMLYVSILLRVGEVSEAERILLERYNTLTPPNDVLLQAYFDIGDLTRAIAVGEARVAEAPGEVSRYTQLAGLYLEAERRADAIATLETAIQVDPSFKNQAEEFIQQIESGEI